MTHQARGQSRVIPFEYSVVRSSRKTAAIHVSARGVSVRIPHHVKDDFVLSFLQSKVSWVVSKLDAQSKKQALVPKLKIGSPVMWMGQSLDINYRQGAKKQLSQDDSGFVVEWPSLPSESDLQNLFVQYFKRQAKKFLTLETLKQAETMGLHDSLDSIGFRRTKSKWGHCTSKGAIQYNWLIMGAPLNVIHYLVVHEVAHLKYPHHQSEFWEFVSRYCDDYQACNKWLKQDGLKLAWI